MIKQIKYSGKKKDSIGRNAIINIIEHCLLSYKNSGIPTVCEFKSVYVTVNMKKRDENRVKVGLFTYVVMVQTDKKFTITSAKVYRAGACVSPVHIDFTRFKLRKRQSHIHAVAGPFSQTFLVNRDFDIDPEIVKPSKPMIVYKVTQRKRQLRFIRTIINLPSENTEIMYMLNLMSEIKVIGKH